MFQLLAVNDLRLLFENHSIVYGVRPIDNFSDYALAELGLLVLSALILVAHLWVCLDPLVEHHFLVEHLCSFILDFVPPALKDVDVERRQLLPQLELGPVASHRAVRLIKQHFVENRHEVSVRVARLK